MTTHFCRIFVDLTNAAAASGTRPHNDGEDIDDAISLSTVNTVDIRDESDDEDEYYSDEEGDENTDDDGCDGDTEESEIDASSTEAVAPDRLAGYAAEVIVIDDTEEAPVLDEQSPVNTAVASTESAQSHPTAPRDTDSATATEAKQKDDTRRARKYKRMAQQLKQRVRTLEGLKDQHQLELGRMRTLSSKLDSMEQANTEMGEMIEEFDQYRAKMALDRVRVKRERDELRNQLQEAEAKLARLTESLEDVQKRYQKEIERAQSNSMAEVQSILQQQPKLIQANQQLRQDLVRKDQKIDQLKRQLSSISARPPVGVSENRESSTSDKVSDEMQLTGAKRAKRILDSLSLRKGECASPEQSKKWKGDPVSRNTSATSARRVSVDPIPQDHMKHASASHDRSSSGSSSRSALTTNLRLSAHSARMFASAGAAKHRDSSTNPIDFLGRNENTIVIPSTVRRTIIPSSQATGTAALSSTSDDVRRRR
jgi:hypothetical protein